MDIVTSSLVASGSPAGRAYLDQVLELPDKGILAVADTVRGGEDGRAGVKIALEAVRTSIERHDDILDRFRRHPTDELRDRVLGVLEDSIARAAQEVFAYARRRDVRVVIDVVLLLEHEAFVGHVGDGRVYLVRRGLVHQLTVDHSKSADDDVFATVEYEPPPGDDIEDVSTAGAPRRVARALGAEPSVRVESLCMELSENDRFVLCTRAVHHHIPEGVLHHHLLTDPLARIGIGLANSVPDLAIVGVAGQLGGADPDILDAGRSRLAILAPIPLFAHCSERELRSIATATHPRRLPAGTVLFRQGDPGTELYLVISGRIRIERDGNPIATLGPGNNFGEMAMLDEPQRSATAIAADDVEVMIISRDAFFALLKGNPLLAVKILWNMLLRLSAHLRTTSKALAQARSILLAGDDDAVLTAPLVAEPERRTVEIVAPRTVVPPIGTPRNTPRTAAPRGIQDLDDPELDLLGEVEED